MAFGSVARGRSRKIETLLRHCFRIMSSSAAVEKDTPAQAEPIKTALCSKTTGPVLLAQSHYEHHSANSYENSYFSEAGAYTRHLSNSVRDTQCLSLEPTTQCTKLLDLGGGTGNFTQLLVKHTQTQAIVIDPFLESTKPNGAVINVLFVKAAAEEFMADPKSESSLYRTNYDQVLMKKVAHHFRKEDRVGIFTGLYHGLNPQHDIEIPSLLLITRPLHDIDYPLWDDARDVWAEHQPPLSQFIDELQQAGFQNVKLAHTKTYLCSIGLERWQNMIKARFWSTFASFFRRRA